MKFNFIKNFKLLLLLLFLIPTNVFAYNFENSTGLGTTVEGTGHKEINVQGDTAVFNIIMPLIGIAYLILMMYAGYLWMSAQGNEEQLKKAKGIIVTSTIGLLIALSSYAIAYYVVSNLQYGTID